MKLILALMCVVTLSGCVGVIDGCTQALNPPVDGWASGHR